MSKTTISSSFNNNIDTPIHVDLTQLFSLLSIKNSFNNNVNSPIIVNCSNGHQLALNRRLSGDDRLLSSDIELRDGLESYGAGKDIDAIKHFQTSAALGNVDAMNLIGACYFNAIGIVEVDEEKAIRWFEKAAKRGNLPAMANLAYCYENGKGVKKDLYKTEDYYMKIALQGDLGGVFCLASFYYRQKDEDVKAVAIELFDLADDYGHTGAHVALDYIDYIEDESYNPFALASVMGGSDDFAPSVINERLAEMFLPEDGDVGNKRQSNKKEIAKAVRQILNRRR